MSRRKHDEEFDRRLNALGNRFLCAYGFSVTLLSAWWLIYPAIAGTRWARKWMYEPLGVSEQGYRRMNARLVTAWDMLGALLLLFPGLGLKFGGTLRRREPDAD